MQTSIHISEEAKSDGAKSDAEVHHEVDMLDKSVERLMSKIETLHERLQAHVLSQPAIPSAWEEASPEKELVPLAYRIKKKGDMVDMAGNILEDILSRLEI